ncbi:alpha/beta fold hydrolase [Tsukamurella soli]|uniref:alpha/beta fold hydrolase n=1 Tax=Tsukamurella soli TaxID=644556 RepID=UPI003612AC1F
MLFIGGLGNDMTVWDSLCAEAEGITAVTVDAPGMGESSMPRRPLYMRELARVYKELIDTLDLDSPTVVGYSFGGAVAQQLAIQSPGAVSRLVLCATGPGLGGVPGDPVALMEISTPSRYYSIERLRRVSPLLYGGMRARKQSRFHAEQVARTMAPPSALGYSYQMFALMGWSSLPWLPRIQAPTLIVAGDDDPVFPLANAHLMAACIPHATVAVRGGSGHLVVIDDAPSLGPLISRFARNLDLPTSADTNHPEGLHDDLQRIQ